MIWLLIKSLRFFALRYFRELGYRGNRLTPIICVVAIAMLGLALLMTRWVWTQFDLLAHSPFRQPSVVVIAFILFMSAGFIVLIMEFNQSTASRLRAALSTLPLTSREIATLLWFPYAVASAILLVVTMVVGIVAIFALGYDTGQGVGIALLALLSGFALTALMVSLTRIVLSSESWMTIRLPTMVSLWMVLLAAEAWQTLLVYLNAPGIWSYFLVFPLLAYRFKASGISSLDIEIVFLLLLLAIAFFAWSAPQVSERSYSRQLWEWSFNWQMPLLTLQLTRVLRSKDLIANLLTVGVIIVGIDILFWKVPFLTQGGLPKAILGPALATVGFPLLCVRGLTIRKPSPPFFLGYSPFRWTVAEITVVVSLTLALVLPGLAIMVWLKVPALALFNWAIPYLIASFGCAASIGWIVAAAPDNAIGQIVNSIGLLVGMPLLNAFLDNLFGPQSAAWTFILFLIGITGPCVAVLVERQRWRLWGAYASPK